LRQSTVFPPAAIDVIAIGEEAGQLDTVLFRLAQMYKEEVDHTAIPAEPPSPVITGSAALAFRKLRCEKSP
jgi:hypothetical protein